MSSPSASPTNTDLPRRRVRPAAIPAGAVQQSAVAARRTGSVEIRSSGCLSPASPGFRSGMAATSRSPGASTRCSSRVRGLVRGTPDAAPQAASGRAAKPPAPGGAVSGARTVDRAAERTGLFAEAANPAWKMAGDVVGSPVAGSISINRDMTAAALLRLITCASVFWLALQLCRDASRARALLGAIALIGAAYAAYGLIAAKTGWFRMPDMPQGGTVSATFINPNSYAAFAGIGLLTTIGIFFRICRRYGVSAWSAPRQQAAVLIEMIGRAGAPVLAGGFMILAALLLTGSRGGIAATGLAVVVLVLIARRSGARRNPVSWPVALLGVVFAGEYRAPVRHGCRRQARARRFGRSESARGLSPDVAVDRRSSLVRVGVWHVCRCVSDVSRRLDRRVGDMEPGAQHLPRSDARSGDCIRFDLRRACRSSRLSLRKRRRARRENAMAPGLAVAAAVLVGAHAAIDFSLQIEAVALTFAALLGAGIAQTEGRGFLSRTARYIDWTPPRGGHRYAGAGETRLTALATSVLCGCAVLQGFDLARSAAAGPDDEKDGFVNAAAGEAAQRWLGIPGLGRSAFDLPWRKSPRSILKREQNGRRN